MGLDFPLCDVVCGKRSGISIVMMLLVVVQWVVVALHNLVRWKGVHILRTNIDLLLPLSLLNLLMFQMRRMLVRAVGGMKMVSCCLPMLRLQDYRTRILLLDQIDRTGAIGVGVAAIDGGDGGRTVGV